jgi:hypothetical protein
MNRLKVAPRLKSGKLRNQVILNIAKRLYQSPVALGIWCYVVSHLCTWIFDLKGIDALMAYLLPLFVAYLKRHVIFYEIHLIIDVFKRNLGYEDTYNSVDNDLYLGCIPFDADDSDILIKKLGITSILSIYDKKMIQMNTIMGIPVQPNEWEIFDINHLIIEMPEFCHTMSPKRLHCGADFINKYLSTGQDRIYVHCRNGNRLSALVIMAYFIKYKNMKSQQAYDSLVASRRRPEFAGRTCPEVQSLLKFEETFRTNSNNDSNTSKE